MTSDNQEEWEQTEGGIWVPNLFPKQMEIFNSRSHLLLVCGPRLSGKTYGVLHRIVRHLWETKGAHVGFIAKSKGQAKDGGPWQQLIDLTMPEWLEAGIGLEYTSKNNDGYGPKQDAQTRTAFFKIRNMYWPDPVFGESQCSLFSVEHDHEAIMKLKSKNFSLVFISELSLFKTKDILTAAMLTLRMGHLKPFSFWQQFIADTNPDEELGRRSWIYKVWYEERVQKDHKHPTFQEDLGLIEVFQKDNPHLDPRQLVNLEASCEEDQCKLDSWVHGIWGDGVSKASRLFSPFFSRSTHVIGGGDGEGDQIDVQEYTDTLHAGWDLGTSNNHGAGMLEKFKMMMPSKPGGPLVSKTCWAVLDEVVYLKEKVSLDEFALEFFEKMVAIETKAGRQFIWQHWSDDSSTNVFRASSGSYDYMEISAAIKRHTNGERDIELVAVNKPSGSVSSRIRLLRKYLREGRLFVSSRCTHVIAMLEEARKDLDEEFVSDQHKHTFDWLTYPMYMEEIEELTTSERPKASESDNYVGVA